MNEQFSRDVTEFSLELGAAADAAGIGRLLGENELLRAELERPEVDDM